jgi:hypothetical protein
VSDSASDFQLGDPVSRRGWRPAEHRIELRGISHPLRLVCFATGWLASVDTVEGPTLGCDTSPYLAVSRALEPIGGGLIDAMGFVAELRLTNHISAAADCVRPADVHRAVTRRVA